MIRDRFPYPAWFMMKKVLKALGHTSPLLLFFVFEVWSRNEILTAIFLLVLFVGYFVFFGYHTREWVLVVVGGLFGFVIEILLGFVYREQFWTNTSIFDVPIWLPIVWAFGFVVIRRFGDALVGI